MPGGVRSHCKTDNYAIVPIEPSVIKWNVSSTNKSLFTKIWRGIKQ